MKKTPAVIAGVFLLFTSNLSISPAHAAVPSPEVSLSASTSNISGTSWRNDGSKGGSATLGTWITTVPTYLSADASVPLNASAGQGQFITQSLGTSPDFYSATIELNIKIPATQANSGGTGGMVFGWSGTAYDIWIQDNSCIGFNTGISEIYGFSLTNEMRDSFHLFTFIMSKDPTDSGKQVIYVDGVKKTLGFCKGTSSASGNKIFNGTSPTYNIGRYGGNNQLPGSLSVRGFKLWLQELSDAQIRESYLDSLPPASHTIALTSGLNSAVYRTLSTLRSTTDVNGKITFLFNGKRIPGCINIQTVNKIASCSWKPSAINYNYITAQLVAPGGSLTTSTFKIFVAKRTGLR